MQASSTNGSPPIFDLDALAADVLVKINGQTRHVKPVNAIATKLAESMTDDNRLDIMLKIAGLLVPELSADELAALTVRQLDTILVIAARGVEAVQASDPNADRPASEEVAAAPTNASPA